MSQHVIYSYDPTQDAKFAYRSFPVSCYGLGDTLDEARQDYAAALEFSLDGDPVPDGVEHLEQRHALGFWTRIQIGEADQQWREWAATVFLNTLTHDDRHGAFDPRDWGHTDIGEPIVIACLQLDPIGSVIDQLTEREACSIVLSFRDPVRRMEASWVCGIARESAGPANRPVQSLSDAGLTLDSTMEEFMNASGVTRETIFTYQRATTGSDRREFTLVI